MSDNVWSLPAYGLTFNNDVPDETGCRYLTRDSGWRGGAAPRPQREAKPSSGGDYRRPNYPAGLVCTLNGDFWGPDAVARSLAEMKLAAIGRDSNGLFEVRQANAVGEFFSLMELDGQPMVDPDAPKAGAFSFQFASPDYRKYGLGQTMGGTVGLPVSSGGLDWVTGGGLDWDPGLDWGTVTSTGQLVFTNVGNAPTDPVFTFTPTSGTLVNPQVTFKETGQRLRYNGTLAGTDVLRIDTSEFTRSVLLNGSTDVRSRLDVAEWFQIQPGSSTVVFSADNANAAASMVGTAFAAYW